MDSTKTHLVLLGITSSFILQGDTQWFDEGIQCLGVEVQSIQLGKSGEDRTFTPLATPTSAKASIKNAYQQLQKNFAKEVTYAQLTPYTKTDLSLSLCENFLNPMVTWHPFYTRFLSNLSLEELFKEESAGDLKAFFTDQEPATCSPKKRTADLNFIPLIAPEGAPFLPADQAAFGLIRLGYKNVAVAIFANPKFLGGGTNDKESLFYMNTGQEEQTFLCFPGLFSAMEALKFVHKVTWAGKDKEGNDVYEPFNREKTLAQGALPRYRYSQKGIDKDLAPDPEIIKVEEGSLGFKKAPQFSTFAIKDACMVFISTTKTFEEIRDKHNKKMCAYNPLETPIDVNLIFTAAPELPLRELPINTFLSVEYLKALVEDLKTQMSALKETKAETFITGPIGCGIFGNDMRAVALAYAYVFMHYGSETLKNIAITDMKFYKMVKEYWEIISRMEPPESESEETFLSQIFEMAFPEKERQLNLNQWIFHKRLKERVPLCPANSDLAKEFDALLSEIQKKKIEKVHMPYGVYCDYCKKLKKMKGFNICVNRNGKFITELIEVFVE